MPICSGTAGLWWINDGLTLSRLAAVVDAGGGRALLIRHMFESACQCLEFLRTGRAIRESTPPLVICGDKTFSAP